MVFWEDVQAGWSNFTDWLGSIGLTLSETYGQLGQGIFSGLAWLGENLKDALEWIYKGLVWLADKISEGLKALGSYISTGLEWIGSGLSWLGEQLYNFGHWLYNGIISSLHWLIKALGTVFNWIAGVLSSIWNALCNIPNTFVSGFNSFFTSMVIGFRSKFKMLLFVNTTIPALGHQLERLPEAIANPPQGKSMLESVLGQVAGLLLTPVVSYSVASILDKVLPTPQTEAISFFPALELPEWVAESMEVPVPEEEADPVSPGFIPPTAPGYEPLPEVEIGIGTSYEATLEGWRQGWADNGIGITYELVIEE